MAERVIDRDLGIKWDPNVPAAVLMSNDVGRTVLALRAHWDDENQQTLVMIFDRTTEAFLGGPNDEGRHGHRLYSRGLDAVLWLGVVVDGPHQHDLQHFIIPLKEATVEVVARTLSIVRVDGSTAEAATSALADVR